LVFKADVEGTKHFCKSMVGLANQVKSKIRILVLFGFVAWLCYTLNNWAHTNARPYPTLTVTMMSNPFYYGGHVQPDQFVGRKAELRRIFSALETAHTGQLQSVSVVGPRRIGVSMLRCRVQNAKRSMDW